MPTRTTTKPEPVPAGEPAPQPVEGVPPTAPAPQPSRFDGMTAAEQDAQLIRDQRQPVPLPGGGLERWERLSVGEAIAEVTRRIDAIPKTGRATGQGGGYAFRGIDDAYAALHPLLGEVGLVILPGQVVREVFETRATASGGTLNVARLLVRYTLVGPDGSELSAEAWGEAGDSGDKATQKAHSQSYKTLVFQAFSIPTEQSAVDEPDRTNEPARPFTAEERARAQAAWGAARQARSVEDLAGVRRRALALLAVPLDAHNLGEDRDALAPLSWWIDQRRAELERPGGEPA